VEFALIPLATRFDSGSDFVPQAPRSASDARQARVDEVSRGLDLGVIRVPLSGVDEQHLTGRDLSLTGAIVEMQAADSDDQRHWDRIAMLRNVLTGVQSQADHPHRSAVGDLLEAKGAVRSFRALHCHCRGYHARPA
jgi:hypothetical protein